MLEFVRENFALICSGLAAIVAIVSTILGVKGKSGKAGAVFDAIKWALKALPGFITFSETVNAGADGATKKAFVMEQITNNFAVMGVVIDEATIAEISETIDKIVAATKRLHTDGTKGGSTGGNIQNDIGTVTGLRS